MSTAKGISELLLRWQVLRQQGERPSAHDLCVDCPELAEELRRRIEAFESMEAMLGMGPARTVAEPHLPGAAAHADTPIASPFLIPGYELLQVIDQGGMGVVYKANQLNLHRLVALKMIAGFRAGPKQVARFRI